MPLTDMEKTNADNNRQAHVGSDIHRHRDTIHTQGQTHTMADTDTGTSIVTRQPPGRHTCRLI